MQIRLFSVPVHQPELAEEEMNRFLRGHRVLEVVERFLEDRANSRWCFLVKYLEGKPGGKSGGRGERIDYKDVLDEASFVRFCALRKARKQVADSEGVPAFALFTDKQMAELAGMETFTPEGMRKVDGIGGAKAEKYGKAVARALTTLQDGNGEGDEASGESL